MKTLFEMQEERVKEFWQIFSHGGYDATNLEEVERFLKQSIQLAYENGFAEGEYQPAATISLTKEYRKGFIAGLEKAKELLGKFTRYGTAPETGNKWAYLCEEVDSMVDEQITSHRV